MNEVKTAFRFVKAPRTTGGVRYESDNGDTMYVSQAEVAELIQGIEPTALVDERFPKTVTRRLSVE